MRTATGSVGLGAAAVVVMSLVTPGPRSGLAQADPFLGTWVLNIAKSKYVPGPPPKDQTLTTEAAGKGVKTTVKGTDAAGKPILNQFTANYDGKDYPVTGNQDWDATSFKRVDANTLEFTRKKAGKVVQTGTNVVSKDGKTRTLTTTGVNAQGQKINNVVVWEKK